MSPESLIYNKISKESDVWSYGILLWEIYTLGCTPYPGLSNEEILDRLKSGYRMEKPQLCDAELYEQIILACWREEPKQRPSFIQLALQLDQYQQKHQPQLPHVPIRLEDLRVEFIDQTTPTIGVDDDEDDDKEEKDGYSGEGHDELNREVKKRLTSSASSFNQSSSVSTNVTNYTTTGGSSSQTSSSTSFISYERDGGSNPDNPDMFTNRLIINNKFFFNLKTKLKF